MGGKNESKSLKKKLPQKKKWECMTDVNELRACKFL